MLTRNNTLIPICYHIFQTTKVPKSIPKEHSKWQAITKPDRLKANIYGYYEQRLQKMYALDFDDLLLFTARLFRVSSDVLKKWQARFDSICVDEFQDVDHIQYEIVRQLAGKTTSLCRG